MERETIVVGITDQNQRKKIIEALQGNHHTVIGSFGSPEELINSIDRFKNITVGVLDGKIPKPEDAEYIAQLLRKRYLGVMIISYADTLQTFGDDNIQKPYLNKLLNAIVKL